MEKREKMRKKTEGGTGKQQFFHPTALCVYSSGAAVMRDGNNNMFDGNF